MREAFSNALIAAAENDPKVLLLTGDHGYALFDAFRQACPDQYLNCGIAEQNMVGVAAGLAKASFRPIVYGLAAFVPIRVLEQIKIDICYEELPVTFIGDGAGVVYAQLGASHQSTEDIACLRAIPNLSIYSPGDRFELTACMQRIEQTRRPAYVRIGKADLGDIHSGALTNWENGDLITVTNRPNRRAPYLFIGTGSGVNLAQKVAAAMGNADIVSVPCIKPFNESSLHELAEGREAIVTFEEHSIYGGLGGLVAETLIGRYIGAFVRVGIPDQFSTKCGNYPYLMESHGLDAEAAANRIEKALAASAQCQQ